MNTDEPEQPPDDTPDTPHGIALQRFTVQQEGEPDLTMFLPEHEVDGQPDEAVHATAGQALRLHHVAQRLIDTDRLRSLAEPFNKPEMVDAIAKMAAGAIISQVGLAYAERQGGDTADEATIAALNAELTEAQCAAAVERIAAHIRESWASDPSAAEHLATFIMENITAWALHEIEQDLGLPTLMAMPEAEFQQTLNRYVFDQGLFVQVFTPLIELYVDDFSHELLEDLDLEHTSLQGLRQLLGLDPPPPTAEAEPAPGAASPTGPRTRATNRKIELPWPEGSLFPVPNVQNHGVRNLAHIIARDVRWQPDPGGGRGEVAVLDGKAIGRIDFTPSQEGAERKLLDLLGPRAIKTMVVTSRLIIEGTNRSPLNHAATLRVGEIARAMGYKVGRDRKIDPEIIRRVAGDVYMLSKVETWAADGPYDPKTKQYRSGWVAPLIAITAVHAQQLAMEGPPLPFEFDAMLGRNWAQALLDSDLLQIAPGLMDLHDENVIRLAWYYLTEFRYRMTKRTPGAARKIAALCAEARIDAGQPKHRGRFLERLEGWHVQLADKGVIGTYARAPTPGEVKQDNAWTPARIFAEGEYHVEPPPAILEAYQPARQHALRGAPNGKQGRRRRSPVPG
jgi:hypothetical protein